MELGMIGLCRMGTNMVRCLLRAIPTSGTPAELLSAVGIDAEHIAQAVRERL